jgi:hypothetical protein
MCEIAVAGLLYAPLRHFLFPPMPQHSPKASDAEIRRWIELCEIRAAAARMNAVRLDGLEEGRTDNVREIAASFDDLAAFLRDLL